MGLIMMMFFAYLHQPPTMMFSAPAAVGGTVVIQTNRDLMKAKPGTKVFKPHN